MIGFTVLLILIVVGLSVFIWALLRLDTNMEIPRDWVDSDTGALLVSFS